LESVSGKGKVLALIEAETQAESKEIERDYCSYMTSISFRYKS